MELLNYETISAGLAVLSDPYVYLLLCFGALIGLVFGATPGLTAPAAIALVLPITYGMGINASLALLMGVYVSGYFAGSIPAILLNTPGTPGNAASALDGYPMARKGQGAVALTSAVVSSFIGVFVSVVLLLTIAPLMARVALSFTSVEYFALAMLGILCVAGISTGSLVKGLAAALFGILVSTVGLDSNAGVPRFIFGQPELMGGVPIIPALIGLFAIAEMLNQSRGGTAAMQVLEAKGRGSIGQTIALHVREKVTVIKSALIGTFVGVLPGTGPAIASWIAYGEAVRTRRHGEEFGKGAPRGLIAAESANNAVIGGAMIPLLTLGIPGDPVTAILIGAMMIQGVEPGPFFMRDHADLFLAVIVILLLSNVAMAVFGLGLRRVIAKVLDVPRYIIVPVVAVIAATAAYAVSYSGFDILLLGIFGVIGLLMLGHGFPVAAVVLGIVLGPILETNFRNALIANDMDLTVFITRPISGGIFLGIIVLTVIWRLKKKRPADQAQDANT